MKKILFFSLLSSLAISGNAQNSSSELDPSPEYQEAAPAHLQHQVQFKTNLQSLIWSEDFANGIPAGWNQFGTPALALWEYRGSNTAPNDTVGSRGCWAGPLQSGNTGDPIASPTATNGFIIFDSDYLHSNGDRATNGQGTVPAPHVGRLRTDTIDLSNEAGVELSFYSYARRFQSAWFVAISIDGGITFPDTVEVFPTTEIAVNASTAQNAFFQTNISHIVANQAAVVLEFVFDGNLSNTNGSGRYFWMIDDIQLNSPPANQLVFTRAIAPGTNSEAPAHDIIYNGGNGYPKYLNMAKKQAVPIEFDSNIYNYGSQAQTNVKLEVEIWDSNNNLVTTLVSPAVSSLNSLDTAYYTTLTTPSWTPSLIDDYKVVYKATSDSISAANTSAADTFNLLFSDSYSLDDGTTANYFGSNTGTNGMIAFGVLYALEQEDSAGDPGFVYLQGVDILFSCLTDSTADIEIAIWDTLGFEFNRGYPASASPIYRKAYTLDGSAPCNLTNFSLEDAQGNPLKLPTGTYHIVVNFFPNATDGVIRVANSATWDQPSLASVFQNQNGDWFSTFTNSTTFVSPRIRLVTSDPSNISIKEESLANFSVYPNPSTGKGFIEFSEPGAYKLSLYTMLGQEVYQSNLNLNAAEKAELNLEHLPNGVYLLNISKASGESKTVQLTIKN